MPHDVTDTNDEIISIYRSLSKYLNAINMGVALGVEIEFYLPGAQLDLLERINNMLSIYHQCSLMQESGPDQYEICLQVTGEPYNLAHNVWHARDNIVLHAAQSNVCATFDAKPFPGHPGNGMHVHINYLDSLGRNMFARPQGGESEVLVHAVGGLCAYIAKHMAYFAPTHSSYNRFEKHDYNTPTRVSWGNNNRTAAIRIPPTNNNPMIRRLEHRVPGADSNPFEVILAVILGSLYGIRHKTLPPQQTYGLAFDEQYELDLIPANLDDAIKQRETILQTMDHLLKIL